MDGFEFLDELRGRAAWQDIPVVVVTAKDLTEEDRNRLNGGVERIICFVRRLHCYYDEVRLLVSMHHRLRLLAFPMRTADANNDGQTRDLPGSNAIHLRVMCSSTPTGRRCLA
jgi:CheY-like chemotaxis protein